MDRNERLGRSDLGVILFRKIWERELRAESEAASEKLDPLLGEVAERGLALTPST